MVVWYQIDLENAFCKAVLCQSDYLSAASWTGPQIDSLVYELYELTEEEIEIVESKCI